MGAVVEPPLGQVPVLYLRTWVQSLEVAVNESREIQTELSASGFSLDRHGCRESSEREIADERSLFLKIHTHKKIDFKNYF